MTISEIKSKLVSQEQLHFELPDGSAIPEHFHITEVGMVSKHFIDCGGTVRHEKVANFQLWVADDYHHRLHPQKLLDIIRLSEEKLGLDENLQVEVEYQASTIGKYGLEWQGQNFMLTNSKTDCLAKDKCGIPARKPKMRLSALASGANSCAPKSGCC